nr:HEAT repeat domain-containing protein [Geodermatophilaceae bacterium]
GLCRDDVPRVRAAAAQGLAAVGEGENAPALRGLADDPQDSVRRAAEVALRALSHRLDRHFD